MNGHPYRHWHHGMRWMRHAYGAPRYWGWGWHRRPCCCLFFALPLMVIPLLVPILLVVVLLMHWIHV